MGSADIIPGVSGGTIALITGIYERLVHSIGKINFTFIKPLLKGNFSEFKMKLLEEIDFGLFIPLFLGIGIAMISFARLIEYAMNYYPAYTFAFFLGLILASAYVLYAHLEKFSIKLIIVSIVGFILAFIFVGLNPISATHTLPILFFSGMIAICAMILPGISGAFVLLLLGQYKYMLNALNTMNFTEIIVFILGAVIGILGFSKILDYFLQKHEQITITFLIGVMLGTLRLPYDNIVNNLRVGSFGIPFEIICILFVLLGFILIVILEKKFKFVKD
ncbi:DUF368 domain-containing protein [Methanobrevibacter cuticularis]|nr:DUF368 domain-containing protein [Methanobrevibacter cuticularis]